MLLWNIVFVTLVVSFGNAATNGINAACLNLISEEVQAWLADAFNQRLARTATGYELKLAWSSLVASNDLGVIAGSLLGGRLSDWIGRKRVCILSAIVSIIGYVLQILSKPLEIVELFYIGRLLGGIALGLGMLAATLLLNEVAPLKLRGRLGFSYFLACEFGQAIAFIVSTPGLLGTSQKWHYFPIVGCVFPMVMILFMPFFPESPRHLYLNQKNGVAAAASLRFYRNSFDTVVNEVFEEMDKEKTISQRKNQFCQLFKDKTVRNSLMITMAIVLAKTSGGFKMLLSYSTEILIHMNTSSIFAKYLTSLIGVISVVCTALSMVLVDSLGRRPLVLLSCWGMFASLCLFFIADNWIPIMFLKLTLFSMAYCAWMTLYAIGMGPIGYSLVPELWDQRYRATIQSLALATQFSLNVFALIVTPIMVTLVNSNIFLFHAIPLSLLAGYLTRKCPETKNKSISEIVSEMNGDSNFGDKIEYLEQKLLLQ